MPVERRLAVIDLGSNSFRLVVFTHTDEWWKRTDEIYEPVRVGEHQEPDGPLQPEPMERAHELHRAELVLASQGTGRADEPGRLVVEPDAGEIGELAVRRERVQKLDRGGKFRNEFISRYVWGDADFQPGT